ncbi:MAG: nicotinate-nicotinamide nucleotide adenylyltransferase [Proteobacteria bacterium]|nr:nicotinate-nicotinamide nucleotide adenylyltransferase [Pseudomonadota bacterium]
MTNTTPKQYIIFGGAFDPPHLGHMDILHELIKHFPHASCILIPNYISPHKTIQASFTHRVAMLKLALAARDLSQKVTVDHIEKTIISQRGAQNSLELQNSLEQENSPELQNSPELPRQLRNTTWHTLKSLKKTYAAKLIWVIGQDQLITLKSWYRIDDIFGQTQFCVLPRIHTFDNTAPSYPCDHHNSSEDNTTTLQQDLFHTITHLNYCWDTHQKIIYNHQLCLYCFHKQTPHKGPPFKLLTLQAKPASISSSHLRKLIANHYQNTAQKSSIGIKSSNKDYPCPDFASTFLEQSVWRYITDHHLYM